MPVHILIIVIAVLEVMNDVVVNYLVVYYLWMMIYTFMQMSRVMVVVNNFVSMLSVASLIFLFIIIMLVFTFFLMGGMVLGMPMLMFMFILFVLIALIKVMYYLVVHHLGILGSVQLVVV